jgi:mRNA interferase YafQ
MKRLHPTTQFRKDFKKYARNPKKVRAFEVVADMLIHEQPLPERYKLYPLKGNYSGCMECHIESDYLLIWIDGDIIELLRIGSHAELFGK